ncbi:DNA alkylation repair protein [Lactiplantibacillus daoliensis]|uniref:DNA alkylation repair protein n=1 Tax=Lactiplantibacillus daoliensis TaxID=2559916 RepID=A0ABW1ULT9_9LACO|nr:DNA alkylation repair protein [Lactiplantibacillus daoliensis]
MPQLFLPSHPENQVAMAAYMRDQFFFLGVKATERRELTKPIIKLSRQVDLSELQAWIAGYMQQPAREYQYVAIDLALANVKRFTPELFDWCVTQITVKAWWDTVDAWRKVMTTYLVEQECLTTCGNQFITTDEMWPRRVGITLQLSLKDATDPVFLTKAIEKSQPDSEFFIQKAIGWALRDYSKTAPAWVKAFVTSHQLSALAQREALKALQK